MSYHVMPSKLSLHGHVVVVLNNINIMRLGHAMISLVGSINVMIISLFACLPNIMFIRLHLISLPCHDRSFCLFVRVHRPSVHPSICLASRPKTVVSPNKRFFSIKLVIALHRCSHPIRFVGSFRAINAML
jgi:hypothetical protein